MALSVMLMVNMEKLKKIKKANKRLKPLDASPDEAD